MALKFKLDSLDGLDEGLKALYIKGDDGKFTLQVEEGPGLSALRKERDELDRKLKDKEKAEADAKAAKEREDLVKKGEYEKALKATQDRAEALEVKFRMTSRDRFLQEAMTSAGAIPDALGPHVRDLLDDVPDGDGFKHVVKGDTGRDISDFIASFKETKPWAFQPTGASGTGAPAHQPGGANAHAAIFDPKSPTYNYTKQMELAKENPALFQTLRTQFPETKQE